MKRVLSKAGVALLAAVTAAAAALAVVSPAQAADAAGATPSPSPTPTYLIGRCEASVYAYPWFGGYTFSSTITWHGETPVYGQIAVTVPADHLLINSWPVDAVQHGDRIVFHDTPPYPVLQPGQSVTLGYNASFGDAFAPPVAISVSGVPCALS